jgi:hypothetical protein
LYQIGISLDGIYLSLFSPELFFPLHYTILREKSRDRLWSALSEANPAGSIFMQGLPLLQQFYIILGLIEVNDDEVQEVTATAGEYILSII